MPSSIPETPTPWDPATLRGRDCEHCACYYETTHAHNPNEFQGFCRRQPPQLMESRVQVPRLTPDKKPVLKDGKPVMNSEVVVGLLYPPAQRKGTCFDGYRAPGTLPGERPMDPKTKEVLLSLINSADRLLNEDVKESLRQALNA